MSTLKVALSFSVPVKGSSRENKCQSFTRRSRKKLRESLGRWKSNFKRKLTRKRVGLEEIGDRSGERKRRKFDEWLLLGGTGQVWSEEVLQK